MKTNANKAVSSIPEKMTKEGVSNLKDMIILEQKFVQEYIKEKIGGVSYQYKKALFDYVKPNSHPQLLFLFNFISVVFVFSFFINGLTPSIELV
eukprot:gene5168-8774_t